MLRCVRTTVRLDEALMRQVKAEAGRRGQTVTSLIEQGLRRVLDDSSAVLDRLEGRRLAVL